jgi:glycosyltransferase involved in cell wall biosynthesis
MAFVLYDYSNTHKFHRRAVESAVSSVNAQLNSGVHVSVIVGTRNMLKFLPKVLFWRVPCVVNIVGFGRLYTDYGWCGRYIFMLVVWIYCKTTALAFIVEHDTDKNILIGITSKKVYTTHGSGLDVSNFSILKKNFSPKIRLGYLSRFAKSKGTEEIIRLAKALPDDKKLIVAGWDIKGKYFANSFSRLAKDRTNLLFLGRLNSREEISTFMSDIDIFLSPSVREGGNISLQEAIWHHVPFVTTNVPGCDVLAKRFHCPAVPLSDFVDFVLGEGMSSINKDTKSWHNGLRPFMTDSVQLELEAIFLDIYRKNFGFQL